MKLIKFAAFLFYRYYSGGRRPDSSPYFRTICTMTLLAFIHLMQVLIAIDKVGLIPIASADGKTAKQFILFLIMLPIYLLLSQLVRKKELEEMKEVYFYNWDGVFNGYVWLFVYMIFSFLLFMGLAYWSR